MYLKSNCILAKENTCQSKTSGGHEGALISTKSGYCAKLTNKTELEFYRDMYKLNKPIVNHMPLYQGVCELNGETRILVKNLKEGMKKPIEIDIKLGKYTAYLSELLESGYSLRDAVLKTSKMRIGNNFTSLGEYNFVIVGGNFYESEKINKKNIQLIDPVYLLNLFTCYDKTDKINSIIKRKLSRVLKDLIETKYISLIGSSIYIVYDATDVQKNNIKLIDFAHSHVLKVPHKSQNECIIGLKNLIKKF